MGTIDKILRQHINISKSIDLRVSIQRRNVVIFPVQLRSRQGTPIDNCVGMPFMGTQFSINKDFACYA
jgi:hypothetical protein